VVHYYLWNKMDKTLKTGLVASAFDLLHPGHIMLLSDARSRCDHLIAALHTDPTIERSFKNRPVQSTLERYIQLDGCKYVDEIIPYDTEKDLENLLTFKNVDIIYLGSEYIDTEYTGKSLGVQAYFHSRDHDYSSSEFRERINKRS
jgi:glycerol-3-phosphate cytidylyltransferase